LEESKNAYSVVGGGGYTVPTVGRGNSGDAAEREYRRTVAPVCITRNALRRCRR